MNSSPWAKLTTSMMPKMSVNPEAISARIVPVTMPFNVWMSSSWYGNAWRNPSTVLMLHSQILLDERVVDFERGCRAMMPNRAFLHNVDAVAGLERQRHVLLHEQYRDTLAVQHVDDLPDLRDHARHQPFRGLVQQDDLGLEHHRAGDGEHLLLAAGKRAAGLVPPLGEHREIGEGLLQEFLFSRFGHSVSVEAGAKILHHCQQAKNPPILGHVAYSEPRQFVCRQGGDGLAGKQHFAAMGMHQAHDRLERRALADAVTPEQAHDLTAVDVERDAVQDVALAVIGVHVLDRDERLNGRGIRGHVLR